MANTRTKIIVGIAIVATVGTASYITYSAIRKRRILKSIYGKLREAGEGGDAQALYAEDEQLLGSYAFDPNFWQGKKSKKPDVKYLNAFSGTKARAIAKEIKGLIGNAVLWADDEEGIVSQFKKLKSQGQVSMVAYAYSNSPLNYGDMGRSIIDALTGWTDGKAYIKDLTRYINSLPL